MVINICVLAFFVSTLRVLEEINSSWPNLSLSISMGSIKFGMYSKLKIMFFLSFKIKITRFLSCSFLNRKLD